MYVIYCVKPLTGRKGKMKWVFDSADKVAAFLLGRCFSNYHIYKNWRLYVPSSSDVLLIQKELEDF